MVLSTINKEKGDIEFLQTHLRDLIRVYLDIINLSDESWLEFKFNLKTSIDDYQNAILSLLF